MMIWRSLRVMFALTFLVPAVVLAEPADRHTLLGAVVAPAALPAGASSVYVTLGAPELGVGYRQGLGGVEVELRGTLQYLQLAFAGEALLKVPVYRGADFDLAPMAGLALVWNTGSRYFDTSNFNALGLRPRLGLVSTVRLADTVRGIAELDVPWNFALGPSGGQQFTAVAGGGVEVYLGEELTGLVLGQLGVDAIQEPLGVTRVRPGYQLKIGLGLRLF